MPLATPAVPQAIYRAFLPMQAAFPGPDRPPVKRVLLISVDGLRPDAIIEDETPTGFAPNLAALAKSGAASWTARTVRPSATLPGLASMLTGYDVEGHGVETFSYQELTSQNPYIQVPTIFELVHRRGFRTVMISGKNKLDFLMQPGSLDSTYNFKERQFNMDGRVAAKARRFMGEGFGLMWVHLPDVDYAGHDHGWMSSEYFLAVRKADREIGEMLKRLDDLGLRETTLIVITADHGGVDFAHTADLDENNTIPWIIAGPGVAPHRELTGTVRILDTAATVLWALDLQLPPDLDGVPVLDAFQLQTSLP